MTLDMEKLTAYVLGELDDAERQAVEELLTGDEAAHEAVAELKATAAFAREALQVEQPVELAPEQRADIEAKLEGITPSTRRRSPWIRIAAAVVILIGATFLALPYMSRGGGSHFKLASEESGMSPAAREALSSPSQGQKAHEDRLSRSRVEKLSELQKSTDASNIREYKADAPAKAKEAKPAAKSDEKFSVDGWPAPASGATNSNDDVEVYQAYIPPKEASGKSIEQRTELRPNVDYAAEAEVPYQSGPADATPPPAEAAKPHELTNVTVGGSLQIRGNYYQSSFDAKAAPAKLHISGNIRIRDSERYYADPTNPQYITPGVDALALNDPKKVYWLGHNTEAYDKITDNPFKEVTQEPLSTFSIDVDTASYSNVRRFLTQGTMPPPDSVRIEELLNYFDYDYAPPADKTTPFAAHIEVAACPWAPEHRLARVALKGWEMAANERPASNLVFLIDVSGSMQPENKLPLLKEALRMLVRQLDERDRIAIVVYAGSSGLVLPSTPGNEREKILDAIGRLESGGSTQGSAGIQLAYETAVRNFLPGATNRVLLCTDGDFNVGITDAGQLVRMIEEKAKSGVFLTVLGFGMGNLKDANLEQLADKGNGNYAYIDTLNEARKVLVQGLSGTLVTIAKDVKIQVEFNPAKVKAYRLIGYENRIMAAEDFNDDTKDAGEIGAGHSVTALYELVPPGATTPGAPNVDPLKYQQPAQTKSDAQSDELFTLKLRYKAPDGDTSKLLEYPARDTGETLDASSPDFRFASAVAEFGMILRNSPYKGNYILEGVINLAEGALGKDAYGYRTEFLQLVQKAKAMTPPVDE